LGQCRGHRNNRRDFDDGGITGILLTPERPITRNGGAAETVTDVPFCEQLVRAQETHRRAEHAYRTTCARPDRDRTPSIRNTPYSARRPQISIISGAGLAGWLELVLAQGFLDALGAGSSETLVDGEGIPEVASGFGGVAVAQVGVADSLQGSCLFQGSADLAGDG
jgi:hypothetical protein